MSDYSSFYESLNYLNGAPSVQAVFKQQPSDFKVTETLSFEPSGDGEHLFFYIEKTLINTEQVAQELAKHFKISARNVSWAGLKDKHGITQQWFGIHAPGLGENGLSACGCPQHDDFLVLHHTFNNKKLRTGAIAQNHFDILLRDLQGDLESLEQRLSAVKSQGFPNYFGQQRFGYNAANIEAAEQFLLSKNNKRRISRNQRSLLFSVARSYVFNQLLSQRIGQTLWNKVLLGDALMIEGSHSCFTVHADSLDEAHARVQSAGCHLTGALVGGGRTLLQLDGAEWEQAQLEQYTDWIQALAKHNVMQSRRALRVMPQNMRWQKEGEHLRLMFALPSGAYATALLRECVKLF